jgi:serine protease Do
MPAGPDAVALGQPPGAMPPSGPASIGAGLKLAPLTAHRRSSLGVGSGVHGVLVTAIGEDSPFAASDLLPGDVIVSIERQPVVSPADAFAKLDRAAAGGKSVLLLINRHGSSRFLAVSPAREAASGNS